MSRRRLPLCVVLIFTCMLAGAPGRGWAQCATCGQPGLNVGDTDVSRQTDAAGGGSGVRLRGSLVTGFQYGDQTFLGTKVVPPPGGVYKLAIGVLSLNLGADLWTGTGLSANIPSGIVYRHDSGGETTDKSLGDIEVRVRQVLNTPFGWTGRKTPRLAFSAGVVAPTGKFTGAPSVLLNNADPAAANATAASLYAGLGRGVWWILADVDLFGRITGDWGWFASVWTRWPVGDAGTYFRWGDEERISAGASWRFWPAWMGASLSLDWQRRDLAQERVPNVATQTYYWHQFENGGGDFIELSPGLRLDFAKNWGLTATGRVPLYRNVVGLQGVTGPAVYLGVAWSDTVGVQDAPHAPLFTPGQTIAVALGITAVPGKVTLVDYQADWCAPCQELSAQLAAWLPTRPDVALLTVDASDWGQADMDRFLPGCGGLPVLDVYDAAGHLQARLVGADAFGWRNAVQ